MEEGESDYSVVHLGPETQGLPAFHRIVGEDEVGGISLTSFEILIFIIYNPFAVRDKAVLQPRSNGTSDFNEHLEPHCVPGNHVSTL